MAEPVSTSIRRPLVISALFLAVVTGAVVIPQLIAPVAAQGKAAGVSVLAQRDLRFADRADGAVIVTNAADGSEVAVLAPESNNFVRALMRGLVRQRVREAIGPELPFRLTAWTSGHLELDDPATHRTVALEAFGATNAEDFAKLLPLPISGPLPTPAPLKVTQK